MGILRTDRVSGLGGANAIKGSVEFRAAQHIRAEIVNSNADFNYGSGDFTIECWWNSGGDLSTDINFVTLWNYASDRQAWGMYWDADDGNFGLIASTGGSIGSTDITFRQAANFEKNRWYHLAIVRISNTLTLYKDGTSIGSNSSFTGTIYENTVDPLVIGGQLSGTDYDSKIMRGFISNLRIIKGEGIYTGNFTPPTSELTVTPNTVLLACQSPGDILHEATGKKLIAYRKTTNDAFPVASRFTPNSPVGFSTGFSVGITTISDPGTQFGSTFDGVTTFDSQAYMVPPGGNTRERNRGRGIIAGGCTPLTSSIDFFNIQSQGNSFKFGTLQSGAIFGNQMCSSSTRGISGGGAQPSIRNFLDFITIATESDSTDFGDLTVARRDIGALSNQTRGIWTGGSTPSKSDVIDFVTIATIGDATDFGNLTAAMNGVSSTSSPTRGIMGGGTDPSATLNTIQFITIASTGNASDFGDLTRTASSLGAVSSGTRGVFANGGSNTIDFITIASAGNASDFGDSTLLRAQCTATMSNSIRGVFAGGYQPSPNSTDTNTVDFITIATTGNATDFGDISRDNNDSNRENGGCSDSHGGIE